MLPVSVLEILKQQCVGMTREHFLEKAKEEKIESPLRDLKCLIDQGLARIDRHPYPTRFKATKQAFDQ